MVNVAILQTRASLASPVQAYLDLLGPMDLEILPYIIRVHACSPGGPWSDLDRLHDLGGVLGGLAPPAEVVSGPV